MQRPTAHRSARRLNHRRGVGTLEILFVVPILLMMTLAVIQFAQAMLVDQTVSHAATVGAREAAKGADLDEVVCVVQRVLQPHQIQIGPVAGVVLEDPEATVPIETEGMACCTRVTPTLEDDEVRVTVCVNMAAPPFLNALPAFCVNFAGRTFKAASVTRKE